MLYFNDVSLYYLGDSKYRYHNNQQKIIICLISATELLFPTAEIYINLPRVARNEMIHVRSGKIGVRGSCNVSLPS